MTKKFTISEILYLAYFLVMLGAKAIGLYEGQTWYNICLVIGAGLFVLKILLTKHSAFEYVVMALLLSLGLGVYLSSGEKSLLIFLASSIITLWPGFSFFIDSFFIMSSPGPESTGSGGQVPQGLMPASATCIFLQHKSSDWQMYIPLRYGAGWGLLREWCADIPDYR